MLFMNGKKDSIISNSKTFNKYVNGFVKKAFFD